MRGQLFPEYIECVLLKSYRCPGCDASGRTLLVSSPRLLWRRDDESVVITYPVRCSCGKSGSATSRMPFLAFCFICGWLEYQRSFQNAPEGPPKAVRPGESPLLWHILSDFEKVVGSHCTQAETGRPVQPWEPDVPVDDDGIPTSRITPIDRALFGANPEVWRDFLRRMGWSETEQGEV